MTNAVKLAEALHPLRVERKRRNVEYAEKNRREQHVRILIFQCEVCGHQRREAIDESGHLHTELRKRIWKMDIPLPE
jgi:hypothetical protein